ncbi:hypothetical protein SPRG_03615 [Saprolegnia parasitica CBS 223.65]|uniref:Uncharacterized protein n=1 Tax=Saprolegnia parasitica (strain CBS 223.65) TaxID=695850 RepID=A0A067CY53_SAPPC|nr:hypothetical protein SPRG_03615 [Saprolegnia parasitica CBS 223.65]KDO31697.1 hypothetical protein SPRG_03615 [Saprolegnia parasitica CBS 223.65]|eukprot:XP_012197583.1 hypothetical protein SPRG_03615 [Saprolegnia parasitica CBS 223.65]
MRGLDAYFTTPNYRDGTLAGRISVAQMDAFQVTADASILEVSPDLRRSERRNAELRRACLRDEYVKESVRRACSALHATEVHAAIQLLLAAVDDAIFNELLHGASGPAAGLFARLEAATEQYAQSLLWRSFAKAHCSADPSFDAAVLDLTKILMLARAWPVDVTSSFEQTKPLSYELLKQQMMAHLEGEYCFYCHSKAHADAVCHRLAQARHRSRVRAGYMLPSDTRYPSLSDGPYLQMSTRRFCTACQSTRHEEGHCPRSDTLLEAAHHGSAMKAEDGGVLHEDNSSEHDVQDNTAAARPPAVHDRTLSSESTWYEEPVLTDMATFPQWKAAFLARADSHFYVEFYTMADAEADHKLVTPAELREMNASALAAEPSLPPRATIADHDMRTRQRLRHVHGLLQAKRAANTSAVSHEAAAYLRSAVDASLHGLFADDASPFDMWQNLVGSYCVSNHGSKTALLEHLAAMTYSPKCNVALFLERLEAAVARYAALALPPASSTRAALYASVVDGLQTSFLVRALQSHLSGDLAAWLVDVPTGNFAYLKCCLLTHATTRDRSLLDTRANDLEEDAILLPPAATALAAAYGSTTQEDALKAKNPHPESGRLVGPAMQLEDADATTSQNPPPAMTPPLRGACASSPFEAHVQAIEIDRDPPITPASTPPTTIHITCTYCRGFYHVDAVCKRLALAVRDKIVRSGYTLPDGVAFPVYTSDSLVEEDRRFCTYCQSTRHFDMKCKERAKDKKTKCLRRGYVAPTKAGPPLAPPAQTTTKTARKRQRAGSGPDDETCNE